MILAYRFCDISHNEIEFVKKYLILGILGLALGTARSSQNKTHFLK
jgi:hypothetical protein